jgi:hypothetical protein
MKRRSRAGGEPITGRRGKTPEPKRRNAPEAVGRSKSAPAQEDTAVARLTRELGQAREQQRATSDVLRVISSFAGELGPVFQTILANATRLCEAKFANLLLYEGGPFRVVSLYGAPRAWAALPRREPIVQPVGRTTRFAVWLRRSSCNTLRTSGRKNPTLNTIRR